VEAVATGLASSEMIVRGGYLKGPIVLQRLKEVAGKKFMYLTKTGGGSVALTRFLSKEPPRKRPLAKTNVFENIAKLRDAKFRAFSASSAATCPEVAKATGPAATGQEGDACDALGLEEDSVEALDQPKAMMRSKKRLHKKDKVAVPPSAEVCYERPGQPPWTFHVLLEGAARCPTMEATQPNLQMLLTLVDDDITHGATRRAKHGVATASTRPPPRGEPGRRSYAVGRKWVTKITAPGPEAGTPKKIRTLKKRRTGDAGTPPPRPRDEAQNSSPLANALLNQPDCFAC